MRERPARARRPGAAVRGLRRGLAAAAVRRLRRGLVAPAAAARRVPRAAAQRAAAGAALAFACALVLGGGVAHGHGGALLLERDAGPYAIALHAAEVARDGSRAVDLTVTLRRDGRPEEAATVRLQVRADGGRWSRPYPARRAANTYEVMLAQPARDAWRDWDVRVEVDGPAGPAAVVHRAAPPPADAPPPTAALLAALGAIALAAAALVAARRRAARRDDESG